MKRLIDFNFFFFFSPELPSKIYVNQMSSDARVAARDGGNEGDYDEEDEDDHHGILIFLFFFLMCVSFILVTIPGFVIILFIYFLVIIFTRRINHTPYSVSIF